MSECGLIFVLCFCRLCICHYKTTDDSLFFLYFQGDHGKCQASRLLLRARTQGCPKSGKGEAEPTKSGTKYQVKVVPDGFPCGPIHVWMYYMSDGSMNVHRRQSRMYWSSLRSNI